jgi:hypothetical protein
LIKPRLTLNLPKFLRMYESKVLAGKPIGDLQSAA